MKVAAVNQREDSHHSLAIMNFVADDGGILSIDHGNGLFDAGLADLITESGNRIDPKLLQIPKSLWIDHAGILVVGKTETIDLLVER